MKNSANIILTAALLCAAPFVLAAPSAETEAKTSAVSGSLQKIIAREQKAAALDVSTVQTVWKRCDMLESPVRGNRKKRVRVAKIWPWSCNDVTTTCGAVLKDGKVYVSAHCYYAAKSKDQDLFLKDSRLIGSDGRAVSLHKSVRHKVKDFVVFHLK